MKSRLWKQTSVVAAVAAMALMGTLVLGSGRTASARLSASPSGEDDSFRGGMVLVGTWRVKVQPFNCQTNAHLGNPFASLLTFNEGGTLTGSTTNPGFAVAQRGPDAGVWERDGQRTYTAKSAAFLNFTTPPNPPFNPGFQAGTQTITQKIEFDSNPDEFTSDATTEFFDVNGNSYRKSCASAVAQRFEQ
jgi:hypothetical protein